MHISFIIVEISKIFGEIGNLVSFIIVGKHVMSPPETGRLRKIIHTCGTGCHA